MLDSNLSLEALKPLQSGGARMLETDIPDETIAMCKEASDLRNLCFRSKEDFERHWANFDKLLQVFRKKFEGSEAFKFLVENISAYAHSGPLQKQYIENVYHSGSIGLIESASNAMAYGDGVRVRVVVGPAGIGFDVNQGSEPFPEKFLNDTKKKAETVRGKVALNANIRQILIDLRCTLREKIGYMPPDFGTQTGLPFRGNGVSALVTDDMFRHNFVMEKGQSHTVSIHTPEQLKIASDFRSGKLGVGRKVYEESAKTFDASVVDDFFANFGEDSL